MAATAALAVAVTATGFDPGAMRFERALLPTSAPIEASVPLLSALDIDGDGIDELIVATGLEWQVLQHDPSRRTWSTRYRYAVPETIADIQVADVNGDGAPEIVAIERSARLRWHEPASGTLLGERQFPRSPAWSLALQELDSRPGAEAIVNSGNLVTVYRLDTGDMLWDLDAPNSDEIAIANVDTDPHPELIISGGGSQPGQVFDLTDRHQQWLPVPGLSGPFRAVDLDGDGISEIVVLDGWVTVLDAVAQDRRWTSSSSWGLTAALIDLAHDGQPELVVPGWDGIDALDPSDGTLRLGVPGGAVRRAATAAEIDGDCDTEVVWLANIPPSLAAAAGPDLAAETVVDAQAAGPSWSLGVADLDRDEDSRPGPLLGQSRRDRPRLWPSASGTDAANLSSQRVGVVGGAASRPVTAPLVARCPCFVPWYWFWHCSPPGHTTPPEPRSRAWCATSKLSALAPRSGTLSGLER